MQYNLQRIVFDPYNRQDPYQRAVYYSSDACHVIGEKVVCYISPQKLQQLQKLKYK